MAPVRIRRTTLCAVLLCFAVASCLAAVSCSANSTSDDRERAGRGSTRISQTIAPITGGTVRGVRTSLGTSFYGIPYAAPPVGDRRWRPPQPPESWQGVRDATQKARPCLQGSPSDGGLGEQSDEDCLFVDVHVPDTGADIDIDGGHDTSGRTSSGRTSGSLLPVMFWIHGGGFVGGSANEYDGSVLAAAGRVVVVSVEYRLGILGYLALPTLNAESGQSRTDDSGTYAIGDITAALHWVHDNIAAFHGDAGNVTVFGESAGAINTCALLSSPPAFGLFHRAIVQSGPCTWPFPTMQDAERTGTDVARRLGCTDPARTAACMRAIPARTVLAAADRQADILSPFPWAPVVGGRTLPTPISTAIVTGAFARVPVIIGTVKDEGRGFTTAWNNRPGTITDRQVAEILDRHFHDRIDAILRGYPAGSAPPTERLARVITDAMFTCPSVTSASMLAQAGVPVFSYEFDLPDIAPSMPDTLAGASHGWEIAYLIPKANQKWTSTAHRKLSTTMIEYWTRFAATGDPNMPPNEKGGTGAADRTAPTASPPVWPAHTEEQARTLTITPGDIHPISTLASEHHCEIWR